MPVNDTEASLDLLAKKNFFRFWSISNPQRQELRKGGFQVKEICDSIITIGDTIVLFSVKNCNPGKSDNPEVLWRRWFKKCVKSSFDQLIGAKKWIMSNPKSIFVDNTCSTKIDIDCATVEELKFFLVSLSHGYDNIGITNSSKDNSLKFDNHVTIDEQLKYPFTIGNLVHKRDFVHIIDPQYFQVILKEADTVSDFLDYLIFRETLFAREALFIADSEKELVGLYLQYKHPASSAKVVELINSTEVIHAHHGMYDEIVNTDAYIHRYVANIPSIEWDKLIEHFSWRLEYHRRNPEKFSIPLSVSERAIRVMALENRLSRRAICNQLTSIEIEAEVNNFKKYCRIFRSFDKNTKHRRAYVFLYLDNPSRNDQSFTNLYISHRSKLLETYINYAMLQDTSIDVAIGYAVDYAHGFLSPLISHSALMHTDRMSWNLLDPQSIIDNAALFEISHIDLSQHDVVVENEWSFDRSFVKNLNFRFSLAFGNDIILSHVGLGRS